MKSRQPWTLPLAGALFAAVPTAAQPPAADDPDGGWATYLFIKEVSSEFAARPQAATMADPSTRWALWPKAPLLPPDLRRRVFVNESYILLEVDSLGKAVGCRPLRASAQPRLDAESCRLLMSPGYFSAYLLPPDPPRAPEQWVIGARWERVDPATARRNAARPLPMIVATPPPPPVKK